MKYLAHSKAYCGYDQSYGEHIWGVYQWVQHTLAKWKAFLPEDIYRRVERWLLRTPKFHDLGKLEDQNQARLHDENDCGRLPYPHQYAGARYLYHIYGDMFGAMLIYGHHRPGLPNWGAERINSTPFCSAFTKNEEERTALQTYTDNITDKLLSAHLEATGRDAVEFEKVKDRPASSLEVRMMLSCLVNADWNDTAGKRFNADVALPQWETFLKRLDSYVARLQNKVSLEENEDRRILNDLRTEFYQECRARFPVDQGAAIYNGDACVGTGKTTAFLALALRLAEKNQLRHVFLISPMIALLEHVEQVVRKAVAPDEKQGNETVSVVHSRAEYHTPQLRELANSWETPFILTTAVAFYETLAANEPAHLKKLHELPGSVIILDEFHASAPAECLPVIWKWLGELCRDWGCSVILSSGTMVHFWENERFKRLFGKNEPFPIPKPILSEELQRKMEEMDRKRVQKRLSPEDLEQCQFSKIGDLLDFALAHEGPRVILAETREAAARIAFELKQRGKQVSHLSNAFTPEDCERKLQEIEAVLGRPEADAEKNDWTMVATTYAAMGLDLSFRNGFCQVLSCDIYLQLLGRISRNQEYPDAGLWAFELFDPKLPENRGIGAGKGVWREIIRNKYGGTPVWSLPPSQLASYAFREESKRRPGLADRQRFFLEKEGAFEFSTMAQDFKIISNESQALAVVDPKLVRAIRAGAYCDRAELQRKSVSLYKSQVMRLELSPIVNGEDLYALPPGQYDAELLGCFKNIVGTN